MIVGHLIQGDCHKHVIITSYVDALKKTMVNYAWEIKDDKSEGLVPIVDITNQLPSLPLCSIAIHTQSYVVDEM